MWIQRGCSGWGGGGGGGRGATADTSWRPERILEALEAAAVAEDGRLDEFTQLSDKLRLSTADEDEFMQTPGNKDGGDDDVAEVPVRRTASSDVSGVEEVEECPASGTSGGADDGLGGS